MLVTLQNITPDVTHIFIKNTLNIDFDYSETIQYILL